ncbi:MAG TPA: permease-like cell division protein FtsX [Kofleriaceae bacterium]|nr:permease-like cell division protein FtsX [Kofleriaceae bacterium]
MIAPRLASALRRSARLAIDRPRGAAWTVIAGACALFALAAAGLAAERFERAPSPASGASMVLYLGEGVDDAHAQVLVGELAKLSGVEHVELVPPAETARRLERALGVDRAELLDGVDLASLPASVEVTLAPGVRDVIAMSPTIAQLRGTPGIDDVVVEDGAASREAGALDATRAIAWAAAALAGLIALVVVIAAVRLRLDRNRREAAVARMLGAGSTFTIVPTALAGALYGLAAALVAIAALCGALALYGDDLARALHGAIELGVPAISQLALVGAIGAGLGLVGGGLAGASRAAS